MLSEKKARLSALLDQEPASPVDTIRLLRDQRAAQADAEAAKALVNETIEILEGKQKEEGKEK